MWRARWFWAKFKALVRRDLAEQELSREITAHLGLMEDEFRLHGMTPDAARRAARVALGGIEQAKELHRDERSLVWLTDAWRDVRHALRALRKTPGFTFVAVLTLALGVGANTAIFAVFDTVILRPLPFRDAQRLYVIHEVIPIIARTIPLVPANARHFREWRTATRSFENMALIGPWTYTLTGTGEPVLINAARATPSLFWMLGIQPALGRAFLEEEDVPGRDNVVILGHELWVSRFGADPDIIGRAITLDGMPSVVVGVLPERTGLPKLSHFYGLTVAAERPQLWRPFAARPLDLIPSGSFNNVAIARLKPDVSAAQALDDLNVVQADLGRYAPQPSEFRAALVPMADQIAGRSRTGLELVLGVVALVLLIVCVNITNLLLARGGRRQREFAIRRAAGATQLRLMRQMLVESMVLSAVAGSASVAIAAALVRFIQLYAPLDLPRVEEMRVDGRALVFTLAATFFSGLLIGLLPAWRSTRTSPLDLLRSSSATVSSSVAAARLRSLLVGFQVAITAVCLIAGALLLSSFANLMSTDRGFEIERIVTVDLALPSMRYDTPEKGVRFVTALVERARSAPGVGSAGVTDLLPLRGVTSSAIMVEGTNLPRQQRPNAAVRAADPGYFRTLGIPLRAGRILEDSDSGHRVAVISTLAAQRLWPGQNPLGKRFRRGPDDSPFLEVVGVVGDVRAVSLSEDPPLNIYLPFSEYFFNQAALAVRTTSDPGTVAAEIRAVIQELDPSLAVPAFKTMQDLVADSVAARRFQMELVLLLAVAAVFLAGLGIYGVIAQAMTERTSEFGIRMSLGADSGNIRLLVIREGLLPVFAGLAGGILASLGIGRLMQNLLFGVSPTDFAAFAAASLFLVSIAVLASFIPAWRASRMDPMVALRHE